MTTISSHHCIHSDISMIGFILPSHRSSATKTFAKKTKVKSLFSCNHAIMPSHYQYEQCMRTYHRMYGSCTSSSWLLAPGYQSRERVSLTIAVPTGDSPDRLFSLFSFHLFRLRHDFVSDTRAGASHQVPDTLAKTPLALTNLCLQSLWDTPELRFILSQGGIYLMTG